MKLYRGTRNFEDPLLPKPIAEEDIPKFTCLEKTPDGVIWASNDRRTAIIHGLFSRVCSYRVKANDDSCLITLKKRSLKSFEDDPSPIYLLEFDRDRDGFLLVGGEESKTHEWYRTEPITGFSFTKYQARELIQELVDSCNVEFREVEEWPEDETRVPLL